MNSQLLLFIFLILAVLLSFDIIRRAIMTVFDEKNEQTVRVMMRRLRRPKQPHVTVLVYGRNNAEALERTVRQVQQNQYASFDIVAISDRSTDDTAQRLKKYCAGVKAKGKGARVVFLKRRIISSKLKTYQAAYQKSEHGEIVVLLEAGDVVDRQFIKRAAVLQAGRKQRQIAVAHQPLAVAYTSSRNGLYTLVLGIEALMFRTHSFAIAYRRNELKHAKLPARTFERAWQRTVRPYLFQTVLIAVIILGCAFAGLSALWYAWLLFSGYVLALVWLQRATSIKQKWQYTFSIPSALFFVPVTRFTYAVVQLGIRK